MSAEINEKLENAFQEPRDFEGSGSHLKVVNQDNRNPFYESLQLDKLEDINGLFYPRDSIIEDWYLYANQRCEVSDNQIIGAILPVISAIVGKTIYMDWYTGPLYSNLFTVLLAKPGRRKSTLVGPVTKLARKCLPRNAKMPGTTSVEKLFELFQSNDSRILIESEGQDILNFWNNNTNGVAVQQKILKLWDCEEFDLAYKNNSEEGEISYVEEPFSNILIATTYESLAHNHLSSANGLWRRFLKYDSLDHSKFINKRSPEGHQEIADLALKFEPLITLKSLPFDGPMKLSNDAAFLLDDTIKRYAERYKMGTVPNDFSERANRMSQVYLTQVTQSAKVAMIFQLSKYAKYNDPSLLEISYETMMTAFHHVEQCISLETDLIGVSALRNNQNFAHKIIADIRTEFSVSDSEWIELNKTHLTRAFAKNPGRNNENLTVDKLYGEVLPLLIRQGLCRIKSKTGRGKPKTYEFKMGDNYE